MAHGTHHRRVSITAIRFVGVLSILWFAQSLGAQRAGASDLRTWGSVALIAAASAADAEIERALRGAGTPELDRLADVVDPVGRARYVVPTIAGAYIVARVSDRRSLASAIGRIGIGYLAADAVGAALKPIVGRHRPDTGGGAWRFRPFSRGTEWHSFPSAHTVHAFAIAAGIAEEANRGWVAGSVYGVASLVGLQRIYTNAHWTSDVVASAVLAVVVSKGANRLVRRRWGEDDSIESKRPLILVYPRRVVVTIPL